MLSPVSVSLQCRRILSASGFSFPSPFVVSMVDFSLSLEVAVILK